MRLQLRRQQLNEARHPILHEALEQDRLVHPRLAYPKLSHPKLLAGGAPPDKAPAMQGVKQ